MDRLIQMGKDLGDEGEKLQDFVKQQQDYERGKRIAEWELERDRIAAHEKERADKLSAQEKDREIELTRIATEKAKADKERELERDRIAAEEAKADKERELERDRIAAQEKERADKFAAHEKDREIELAKIAADERLEMRESKASRSRLREIGNCSALSWKLIENRSKMISNDQELIQSDPTSCPQNQKGKNLIHKLTAVYERYSQ